MSHLHALPKTDEVAAGGIASGAGIDGIPSEIPDTLARLSAKEKKVWEHVTHALHEVGLIHRTDAMLLTVICKTFVSWIDAEEKLADLVKCTGSYIVTTPNGYQQPHQIYYIARNIKRELLQWLPEAALTIPSFHKIVGERAAPNQGSLFEDPVEAHRQRRAQIGMRVVAGGQ